MPDKEIEVDDDEDIIRVYHRFENETWGYAKLRKSDFARIMDEHSGLNRPNQRYIRQVDF